MTAAMARLDRTWCYNTIRFATNGKLNKPLWFESCSGDEARTLNADTDNAGFKTRKSEEAGPDLIQRT